jgi:hypothetical protein
MNTASSLPISLSSLANKLICLLFGWGSRLVLQQALTIWFGRKAKRHQKLSLGELANIDAVYNGRVLIGAWFVYLTLYSL